MSIDIFVAFLPWLALLACPVMMFWMMRGMSGGQCHTHAKGAFQPGVVHADTGERVDGQIRELRARLARLEAAGYELNSRAEVGT